MGFESVDLYRPVLPGGLLVLLLGVAVVGAVWWYGHAERTGLSRGRRAGLLVLRLLAVAGVGWLLAGPSVLDVAERGGSRDGAVTLLVDTSASMQARDVAGVDGEPLSRWETLRRTWLSEAWLERLSDVAPVRVVGFDERARLLAADELEAYEPVGRATRLFAALNEAVAAPALRDEPAPVFVLLSDGRDTERGHDAGAIERLVERGATVHVVPVGNADEDGERGLAVQAWVDADVLLDGESTRLHAQVWPHGLSGREVEVQLYHEGAMVESRRVRVPAGGAMVEPVTFEIEPTVAGERQVTMHEYEVRAAGVDGDAGAVKDDAMARQPVFVQVSRERIRVALFEGEPYWDTRWLARVLRDDAHMELHAVYHLGADRRLVQRSENASPEAPRLDVDEPDVATLAWFDVVVLGRRAERFFPGEAAGALVAYVRERGGALMLSRGQPFGVDSEAGRSAMTVFDPIAPVVWGEQQVADLTLQLTSEGQASPLLRFDALDDPALITTRLLGMLATTRVERERSASVVLMRQAAADDESPGMAAVVQANVGSGRVMAVLTAGLWRWALLPSELSEYDTVYHLFWSRAIRWLATGGVYLPGQDVSLALDRLAIEPGESVGVRVSTRDVSPTFEPRLRVTDPTGAVQTVALRREDQRATRFEGTYQSEVSGVHRLELDSPGMESLIAPDEPVVGRLVVADRSPERLDPSARPDVLADIAEATGGQSFELDELERLLEALQNRAVARAEVARPRYAFARWQVLALIAGCLMLEWGLRRQWGVL